MPFVEEINIVGSDVIAQFKQFENVIIKFPMQYLHDKAYDVTCGIGSSVGRKKDFRKDHINYLLDKLFAMKQLPPVIVPRMVKRLSPVVF